MNLFNKLKLLSLFGTVLFIVPTQGYAQIKCPQAAIPKVIVNVGAAEVKHDYTKSSAELTYVAETDGRIPFEVITAKGIDTRKVKNIPIPDKVDYMNGVVTGLYLGAPIVEVTTQFETTNFNKLKASCVSAKTITVNMKLYPEIYITKEANYRNRRKCFKTILKHEEKHDKITKTVMLEYQKIMQQNIKGIAPKFTMIPVSSKNKDKLQNQMTQAVVNKATQIMTLMIMEEQKRQDAFHASKEGQDSTGCKKVDKAATKQVRRSQLFNK